MSGNDIKELISERIQGSSIKLISQILRPPAGICECLLDEGLLELRIPIEPFEVPLPLDESKPVLHSGIFSVPISLRGK